jgi:glutamyl-tRNA synthetase
VVELADWAQMAFAPVAPTEADLTQHVTEAVKPALRDFATQLDGLPWDKASIAAAIKALLAGHGLKMPQLATALRVLVCGRPQTPSVDAVLALIDKKIVAERLQSF